MKMNFEKVRNMEERVFKNRERLKDEKDPKKKEILRLKIGIDEMKVKIERLKQKNKENITELIGSHSIKPESTEKEKLQSIHS